MVWCLCQSSLAVTRQWSWLLLNISEFTIFCLTCPLTLLLHTWLHIHVDLDYTLSLDNNHHNYYTLTPNTHTIPFCLPWVEWHGLGTTAVLNPAPTVATGHNEYYPLYISNGCISNSSQHAHKNAVSLVGFLAIPKSKSCSHFSISCLTHTMQWQLTGNSLIARGFAHSAEICSMHHWQLSWAPFMQVWPCQKLLCAQMVISVRLSMVLGHTLQTILNRSYSIW